MEKTATTYFDALYQAARAINSTLDLDDVLAEIVKAVTEATGAHGCSVLVLSDGHRLAHTVTYGLSAEYLQKGSVDAARTLAEIARGNPVIISDVTADERVQYPEAAKREGIGSMLSAPLSVRDVIIGVIRVYHARNATFCPDDVKLVTAIANLSAIAIDNARTHGSLKAAHKTALEELWHLLP